MARTIVCTECGKTVPYGRLSCSACGALLASVAGGTRQTQAAVIAPEAGGPPDEASEPAPTVAVAVAVAEAAPRSTRTPPYMPRPKHSTSPVVLAPTTVVQSVAAAMIPVPAMIGFAASPAMEAAAPVAPAAAAAPTVPDDTADGPFPTGWFSRPTFDMDRLDQGLDWAAAIGSGLIALGMLLPWSRTIIGSGRADGYLSTWGVAGPGHVLFLLWALAVLGLSLVPSRIPGWIRTGLAGFGLGVFALGIAWPYMVGPLGGQVGIVAIVVGAFLLIAAGSITIWRSRHGAEGSPV